MKNIISFSVWGDEKKYIDGALTNISLANKYYPDWIVRFYCQENMPSEYMSELQNRGCEIRPKQFYRDSWFGLYWRFCPMYDDSDINRFIVRDTDARISPREVDAVNEWIESEKPFHIMRDNQAHNVPILGGMWGSFPNIIPDFELKLKTWMQTIPGDDKNPRGRFHNTDQEFLWKYVWPVIKDNHIAHGIKYYGNEKPFRVNNSDNYKVGT